MNTLKLFRPLLLGLALIFGIGIAHAIQASSDNKVLEDRLLAEMERNQAVGLAVAVVKDNEIIYTKSFGWKDLEARIPLEHDDVFRIASISKSFSALAILQLVEQGKLSLDDQVGELIGFPVRNPKFPKVPITLRMLLDHTSSLLDKQGYGKLDIIDPEQNEDWDKSYADYAPGTKHTYCNLGYNTIGAIIEKVSGQRFDRYIAEHILEPLGLYGGYMPDALDADRFAQIYRFDTDNGTYKRSPAYRSIADKMEGYTLGYTAPIFSPTGGMKISAPDLAKYMMVHMNYGSLGDVRIISAEHAALMQRPMARMDARRDYGFALRNDRGVMVPGVKLVGHTGSAYGLNSGMMFDPEQKFGLVMMSNGFAPSDPDFRSRIMTVLYDYFIESTPRKTGEMKKTKVNSFSLVLGAHGKGATKGNFADLVQQEVLGLEEASKQQSEVDLLYTYGKTTGATLMVPSSEGTQYFGTSLKEKQYRGWSHKNMGSLLVLEGSPEHRKLFKKIKDGRQLELAYEKALEEVAKREDYKPWVHGPNARIHGLKSGDIIFLRNNSRDRGILSILGSGQAEILAIGRITGITEGYSGELAIDFKTVTN